MTIKLPYADLVEMTSHGYSFDRYSNTGWKGCIRLLREVYGCNDREIQAVMLSKWTRWAGDMSGKPYGRCNSADLDAFLKSQKNVRVQIKALAAEHFGA